MPARSALSETAIHNFKLRPFGKRLWTRESAVKIRPKLEKMLENAEPGEVVRIDCDGVEVFDFSFAAELFVKTLSSVSVNYPGRCVVFGGLTDYTRENLNAALREAGLMAAETDGRTVQLLGKFSPSDEQTLQTLFDVRRPYSVRELAETLKINVTAANERLTKLARMAVLRRESARSGRTQQLFLAPV